MNSPLITSLETAQDADRSPGQDASRSSIALQGSSESFAAPHSLAQVSLAQLTSPTSSSTTTIAAPEEDDDFFVVEEISESGITINGEDAGAATEAFDAESSASTAKPIVAVTSIADEIATDNEKTSENEGIPEVPATTAISAVNAVAIAPALRVRVEPLAKPKAKATVGAAPSSVSTAGKLPTIVPTQSFSAESMPDLLAQACLSGQLRMITALLDAGADPNACGRVATEDHKLHEGVTPLRAVILSTALEEVSPKMLRKQTARIVKVLLSRGAMASEIERDLLMHCANHNLAEVLDVLGEHKLRLRRYAYDLVGIALHHGHTDVLQVLSKHDCSINVLNDRGNRPFLDLSSRTLRSPVIVRNAQEKAPDELSERIRRFIECGLDLEAADKVGATPLLRAVATGNESMAWALLANGANPRVVMRNGVSITHLAAACMGPAFLRRYLPMTGTYSELQRLNARRLQPDVRAMIQAAQTS